MKTLIFGRNGGVLGTGVMLAAGEWVARGMQLEPAVAQAAQGYLIGAALGMPAGARTGAGGTVTLTSPVSGVVSEIGLRATIVTTFEGAEVVVPNGMLLADKMVNWTLSGTRRRIDINVSTGYDTSPHEWERRVIGFLDDTLT